jgi:hypothetical protein
MNNVSTRELVKDFVEVAKLAGIHIQSLEIEVEESLAPHQRPSSLPEKKMAVYVFVYGKHCLKVGKAGPKSAARYCNRH